MGKVTAKRRVAPVPDAELIELCDRMLEAEAMVARLYSGPGSPDDPDRDSVLGPELAVLDAERDDIMAQLVSMKPVTLAGVRALACLGIGLADRNLDGSLLGVADRDRPLYTVMEWLAGPDHAAWWATDPKVRDFTARPPAAHPDAELLRLGAALEAEWDRTDAYFAAHLDATDRQTRAVIAPAYRLVAEIKAAEARTIEGVMVKARAFAWCACEENRDGGVNFLLEADTADLQLAGQIIRDLLAIREAQSGAA